MATINIANLTFTHKGNYDGSTAYAKNDVVYYATNGNAYIAKQATTGNVPTNGTYWSQFAQGSGGIWNAGLSLGSASQQLRVNSGGSALEFFTPSAAGGVVSSGGFSAGQNVFTYSFSNQTSTSSNSIVDITGSEFNLGGGALTANKTCIFQYSVMRYEQDWNHTAIVFQYSTDDGSNWNYFESSENVHDEEMESASGSELATRSGAFLIHNFTAGQTPRFKMRGYRYGSSNNLKINYDAGNNGTVNSHYVAWFI